MAWELQQHMTSYIAPSIYKYAKEKADGDKDELKTILAKLRADQVWDEFEHDTNDYNLMVAEYVEMSDDLLVEAIADYAIEEVGSTSNGGWEVYLDKDGWNSVPWCSEEELQEWYA